MASDEIMQKLGTAIINLIDKKTADIDLSEYYTKIETDDLIEQTLLDLSDALGEGGSGGDLPVGVSIDNLSIINNDGVISAVGIKSKSDNEVLYQWVGTLSEYEAGVAEGTLATNVICFITDDEI